eukprot:GHVR01048109.1.p1 GENE.GHVR01048109.1~~GHVR01048109.1.p1  ORF type:complete len:270 (+),score=63.90 GHVR01048109.1:43-852(+)
MSNENISFLAVGRARDQTMVASVLDKLGNSEKAEIEMAFQNYLSDALNTFAPGSREKRYFGEACMYLMADRELTCIYGIAIKNTAYPERLAFSALNDLESVVEKVDQSLVKSSSKGGLTRQLRKDMKDIVTRYDQPSKVDKAAEVREKVDQVKDVMQDNVKKILATHGNLQQLEEKTDNLKDASQSFNKNSTDLKNSLWWRNVKITIIIVVILIALTLYLVIPIVVTATRARRLQVTDTTSRRLHGYLRGTERFDHTSDNGAPLFLEDI